MAKAYSIDLRKRVASYVKSGHSCNAAAAHFDVSVAFVVKLMQVLRKTGRIEPGVLGGRRHSKLEPHRSLLLSAIAEKQDITMIEIANDLAAKGTCVAPASISRWFIRNGYSFKKTLRASEQGRSDVTLARQVWKTGRQPIMGRHLHKLVFIDETSTNTKMVRLRGRCLRGQRLKATAPFGCWKTQTFIAGLRCYGLTAPWVIDAPMNRRIFETYVESQLAPTLSKGDVVIMDNLSSHKSAKAEHIIAERGAWILFLPPYSPDLNPIEMAFSKLKSHLRSLAVRTIDQLWKAIGDICKLFSSTERRNYFKAAGYECT